jgi:methionyl-tRNA formyltransferase
MSLRIVFMGTPEFAVPSLKVLVGNNYEVVAVITSPDRLGGRGRSTIIESDVKKYAVSQGLKILQPTNLKNKDFLAELKGLNANLQIVVAFRMLPVAVWDMPEHGTYNLHGSLLPAYRGAAPINWAVIQGERQTGVTSFKLKHDIDTGDMLFQESLEILHHENASAVHDKMKILGSKVILKTVKAIENNDIKLIEQDSSKVSKAPKINKEICQINFDQATYKVYNMIRGLSLYPAAWCTIDGKTTKLINVRMFRDEVSRKAGKIFTNNKTYLAISTADGYIHIDKLQQEGKKRMEIQDFLNGYKIQSKQL